MTTTHHTHHEEEETVTIGKNINKEATCLNCGKQGTTETFLTYSGNDGNDVHMCHDCKEKINIELQKETSGYNWFGSICLGLIAALVGGIIWYYITIGTGKEFGYVALGLGYLIGVAVIKGSGNKRGVKLQVAAGVLTLVAIFFSEYAIFTHVINEYILQHVSEYPGYTGTVYLSLFDTDFLQSLLSPIGLVIYAIGAYIAYSQPKVRKI